MKILKQKLDQVEQKLDQLSSSNGLTETDSVGLNELKGYLNFYRIFLQDIQKGGIELNDLTSFKQKIHEFCNTVELIK